MTQRHAQFFSTCLYLFLPIYTFRTHRELPTCTRHDHRHRATATRDCIDTICLSGWWARCVRNM